MTEKSHTIIFLSKILREINFWDPGSSQTAFFGILGALNFVNLVNFSFQKWRFTKKSKSRASKCVHLAYFALFEGWNWPNESYSEPLKWQKQQFWHLQDSSKLILDILEVLKMPFFATLGALKFVNLSIPAWKVLP